MNENFILSEISSEKNEDTYSFPQLEIVCSHHYITGDKLNGTKAVPGSRAGVHEFRAPGHRSD